MHAEVNHNIESNPSANVLEYILTQHTLDKKLKLNGTLDEHATRKELKQLHHMDTFEPVDVNSLTNDKRKKL